MPSLEEIQKAYEQANEGQHDSVNGLVACPFCDKVHVIDNGTLVVCQRLYVALKQTQMLRMQ